MDGQTRNTLNRLEVIEVLLRVLVWVAGLLLAFYLTRRGHFWLGAASFVIALYIGNNIEDWFIDIRDHVFDRQTPTAPRA